MIHYGRSGKPIGTARVIFLRYSEAQKAVKKYKKMGPNEHLFGYIQKIVLVYIVVDSSRRGHETSVMTTRNYLRAKEMAIKVSQENPTGHNDFWTMKLIGK